MCLSISIIVCVIQFQKMVEFSLVYLSVKGFEVLIVGGFEGDNVDPEGSRGA